MKLAEALVERKAAQTKISELNERLQRVVLVQEGEQPAEQPSALLQELSEVVQRLQVLIVAINRTNVQAQLLDGRDLSRTEACPDIHLEVDPTRNDPACSRRPLELAARPNARRKRTRTADGSAVLVWCSRFSSLMPSMSSRRVCGSTPGGFDR